MQETQVRSLIQEDPLEKETETHSKSSCLESPTEPGVLQPMGSQSRTRLSNWTATAGFVGTASSRGAAQACGRPLGPTWIPTVTSWLFPGCCWGEDAPSQSPRTKIPTCGAVPCKEVNGLYHTVSYFGVEATAWLLFYGLRNNSWELLKVSAFYSQFPGGAVGKESTCQCGSRMFEPWVRKIPRRRKWKPAPGFLPGNIHRPRSLAGYSPRGSRESDMCVTVNTHTHAHTRAHARTQCIHTHTCTHKHAHTHTHTQLRANVPSYLCDTMPSGIPWKPPEQKGKAPLKSGCTQFWPLDP